MQKHFNKKKYYKKINACYRKKEDHIESIFSKPTNKAWIPEKTIIVLKHL